MSTFIELNTLIRFSGRSVAAMRAATERCEEAIATRQAARMVEATTHIARLASRLLQLSKQEADNSEDPKFISILGKTHRDRYYRQTPIFRHPFFRKQCFSLKYVLVTPLKYFGGTVCLNSEYM